MQKPLKKTKNKVLVLSGGFSSERKVSLMTGKCVSDALIKCGYEVVFHDLTSGLDLIKTLNVEKPDVVFNALHGVWGEDGSVQSFLDFLQIPYTHSGMEASVIGMSKLLTKQICLANDIKTAPYEVMTFQELKLKGSCLVYPYVIKPIHGGSSIGVHIIRHPDDLNEVCYKNENCDLMVEKFIPGKELAVAVIDGKACTVTELRPLTPFYDYHAKYTQGLTEHILPADIPQDKLNLAMRTAEKVHHLLGCDSISRTDLRYNEEDGLVVLEINTNPGMTKLSLVPEQASYCGLSYEKLCQILVENAKCRKIE